MLEDMIVCKEIVFTQDLFLINDGDFLVECVDTVLKCLLRSEPDEGLDMEL